MLTREMRREAGFVVGERLATPATPPLYLVPPPPSPPSFHTLSDPVNTLTSITTLTLEACHRSVSQPPTHDKLAVANVSTEPPSARLPPAAMEPLLIFLH